MSVVDAVDFEGLTAEQVVAQIVTDADGGAVCLTSSFQTEDMVVLHMLRVALPGVPVIFLETGYHFPELIAYRDRMVEEWNLNLINALPATTVPEFEGQYGKLHIVQPTECCKIRKVEPLMRSLEPFDWWFTGLRREQSPTRAGLKKVEEHTTPTGKTMKKISILADWTMARVDAYAVEHGIPRLELYDRGYTSIGCEPCTAIPAAGADPRSGRWGGNKLECGIHTFSEKLA
ncbi:phosphoadenylylsulfate reductase (thioredoxin) [Granulicella pectinivorans]|uniref:Adenosine 5'-phosphosulfate reductase n=1 Tax=Granulicella pectinivorans TaxID=474950 RepID=A0A1I6M5F4_9BACT|nr:phosphoadenylyl-sulfate reductase [Granulicella pectinivorans]SFS10930.1 phosphoadenylylsulfate reductase (thioredoxin) [Granulicella pectinivorans]